MSNRKNLISLAPRKPRPASADLPMPTLKEFWEALQQAKNGDAATTPTSAHAGSGYVLSSGHLYGSGSGRLHGSGSGRRYGSGSGSGSGEDTAGYGIDLVVPADHFSAERILTIMRDLCEKENRQKSKQ